MGRLLSFFLLSLFMIVPMVQADEKVDDKVLIPNEIQFDEDKDKKTSMMHEDHQEVDHEAPDSENDDE